MKLNPYRASINATGILQDGDVLELTLKRDSERQ